MIGRFDTWDDLLGEKLVEPRFNTALVACFAAAALVLALGGTFGVISYDVSRSTREIGLRMALGARRDDILRWVVRRGLRLVAAGIVLGAAGALALAGFLRSLMYAVLPTDPVSYAVAALLLLAAGLGAAYLPARRAARIDPMTAIRHE